jgi:hypothetical protein
MKTKNVGFVCLLLLGFLSCGCNPDQPLPASTPGGGFFVQTFGQDISSTSTSTVPFSVGGVNVKGQWKDDSCSPPFAPAGDPTTWTYTSGPQGSIIVWNGRTCAHWTFFWQSPTPWAGCAFLPGAVGYVPGGNAFTQVLGYTCQMTDAGIIPADAIGVSFTPSPTFTNVTTGSVTASANGAGFNGTYGMPLFQYFDTQGTLIAQTNATSVASGGGSATGPVPSNIGSVPPGVYLGRVSNAASGGSYNYLNTGSVTVANGGVTISGQERQKKLDCAQYNLRTGDCMRWDWIFDKGAVSITINGVVSSTSYGQGSTASLIATALANAINSNTSVNTLVSATAWTGTVAINVKQSGSHYSLSAAATPGDPSDFPGGSFSATSSAPTL